MRRDFAQSAGSLAVAGTVAIALCAPPLVQANAQDDARLGEIERAMVQDQARAKALGKQESALRAEVKSLRVRMIATADRAQNLEQSLSHSEAEIARLESQSAARSDKLRMRQGQLGETLAALQRIALRPPDTLMVAPGAPIDAARSALLLSYAVPTLESRAAELRGELAELESLRRSIAAERDALREGHAALERERQELDDLIARKQHLEATTKAERRAAQERSQRLAAEAQDLRGLLKRLEREAQARRQEALRVQAEREAREQAAQLAQAKAEAEAAAEQQAALNAPIGAPGNVRPFPSSPAAARLVMPARGQLITLYGQPEDDTQEVSKGLSIATRTSAQVVAPFDGQVAYAGPFRGYGQILIIEHGGRYHTLLAGLERVDAVEGQWVLAGEPVGVMGGGGSVPVLYVELRRTGQPINPLPWFANSNDKVQG